MTSEMVDTHNNFLPWNLPHAMRSGSDVPSVGSHITSVDEYASEDAVYKPQSQTWAYRLLGILCAMFPKEKHATMHQSNVEPKPESDDDSSLWILPVYVLSTRQDTDKHHIPMEAKCTIDTGNMQGNIVSRKFVEEVLEYPESAFCPLTKEEKVGATGISGHQFIPECAVYLTWYHKKSTRVFRNMRFLVSPNDHCDLVIGAQSIQKHRVLHVPNLMAQNNASLDVVDVEPDPPEATSSNIKQLITDRVEAFIPKIRDADRKGHVEVAKAYRSERDKLDEILNDKSLTLSEMESRFEKVKAEFEVKADAKDALPKYEKVIPKTDSSHTTAFQPPNSGQHSANQSAKRTKG